MGDVFKKERSAQIALALFVFFTIWWLTLRFIGVADESNQNQLFAAVYGVVALLGGIWGLSISGKWGGIHSILGKSLLFFTLGLFFQEIGQLSYSFYIYYLKSPLPYPSIGDLFFYGTIPLYIYAVVLLAQASGVHISLRSLSSKLQALVIPAVMLLLSYVVFLKGYQFDWTNSLKVFLDFVVPFGQAIYISLALLTFTLSRGILGGIMKTKVLFIVLALVAQYLADWTFLFQANREIWYAGGINDYMYLCAYFLMTVGLLQLKTVYSELKER
ncbi:MAG: hypothetical protein ABIO02_01420 [Patescibacteria group bacterium]